MTYNDIKDKSIDDILGLIVVYRNPITKEVYESEIIGVSKTHITTQHGEYITRYITYADVMAIRGMK